MPFAMLIMSLVFIKKGVGFWDKLLYFYLNRNRYVVVYRDPN